MTFGLIMLLFASAGAAWLLFRLAGSNGLGGDKNLTILKIVVLLGIVAALAAARLFPLAFMVLIAAGGVMGIEMWRAARISDDEQENPDQTRITPRAMTIDEAAAFLGVPPSASAEEIRAAHRRLIAQTHPDKGGTDYLAAKINEARALLLKSAPETPPADDPSA